MADNSFWCRLHIYLIRWWVFFFWIHPVSFSVLREWMQRMCGGKEQGRTKSVWEVSVGFGQACGGHTGAQRWWWGIRPALLLDTSTISLWPLPAGGRLISLNHVSLEGVTFSEAAEVMQSSPEEVQLIISQPKGALSLCVWMCVCMYIMCVCVTILWLWPLPSFVCV